MAGEKLEMLLDESKLAGCATQWSALPQAKVQPLLSTEWSGAAFETLHPRSAASALALWQDGALTALAPLARRRLNGIARLELAGAHALHEPTGLLFQDEAALTTLCAGLVSLRRPLVLQRVPAAGPEIRALKQAARGRGRLFDLPAASAPTVRIGTDFDTWSNGLSSRRRQDYRRARRKLEQQGAVSVDLLAPTPATVDSELALAMRIEASGWKQQRGSALQRNASLGAFFRSMARRFARRGELRICHLRVAGEAIATQICLEYGRRWWVLKIGYDEKWSAVSPGIQLMWDVMRHAFERRLESVELLGSAEEWLRIWTDEVREYRTLVFYPEGVRGLAALAVDGAHTLLRRLRRANGSR
jgi:CelD/BcsL family acetyltransferase involved in cellulose biosynthesis